MKKIVATKSAPAAVGPYSQAVWAGDTLYLSGQIAINPSIGKLVSGGIEEQTTQIFHNMTEVLKAANLTLDNIVKTTVFVTDIANFAKVNAICAEFFTANPPARSTVGVKELPLGALVEIESIAVK